MTKTTSPSSLFREAPSYSVNEISVAFSLRGEHQRFDFRLLLFPPTVQFGGRRPLVVQAVAYDSPMNWAEPVFAVLQDYLAGLGEHVMDFTVLVNLSALVGPFELAWFLWAFIVEDGRLVDEHIQPLLNEEVAQAEALISPTTPRVQLGH